jgi:hypothetical protein
MSRRFQAIQERQKRGKGRSLHTSISNLGAREAQKAGLVS